MCLYYDSSQTAKIRYKLKKNKYCVFYKVLDSFLCNSKIRLFSPYYNHEYKSGWNVSNRKETIIYDYERNTKIINKGIHVFTHKILPLNQCVISVKCYLNDFVAAGKGGEAIFTKVFLVKKDYEKVIYENKKILFNSKKSCSTW